MTLVKWKKSSSNSWKVSVNSAQLSKFLHLFQLGGPTEKIARNTGASVWTPANRDVYTRLFLNPELAFLAACSHSQHLIYTFRVWKQRWNSNTPRTLWDLFFTQTVYTVAARKLYTLFDFSPRKPSTETRDGRVTDEKSWHGGRRQRPTSPNQQVQANNTEQQTLNSDQCRGSSGALTAR